jgi:hypothetical protein
MNQCRGFQRVVAPLAVETSERQAAKLAVNERKQPRLRITISCTESSQKFGNVVFGHVIPLSVNRYFANSTRTIRS